MAITLKRKLYSRGGSFETTIPMQLLFSADLDKKNNVVFEYDKNSSRWYIAVVEDSSDNDSASKNGKSLSKVSRHTGGGKK